MRFAPRQRRRSSEDSLLPLINIVFLLLIFFMVAGRLASSDPFEVETPESISEGLPQPEIPNLLLGRDGSLALNGEVVARDELGQRLAPLLDGEGPAKLRLRADARTDTPEVVALMEELRGHGIERLQLITQPQRDAQP